MIVVGQKYTLAWAYPHRIDCTIVELHENIIVADCNHRCRPYCELLSQFAANLTLSGRRSFFPEQFVTQFIYVPEGAIPLPPSLGVTV